MSEALVCDVCSSTETTSAAGRKGWLEVRSMADLRAVTPEEHPLHRPRHLCSPDCLRTFSSAVVEGRALRAPEWPSFAQLPDGAAADLEVREVARRSASTSPASPASDTPRPASSSGSRRRRRGGSRPTERARRTQAVQDPESVPTTRVADIVARTLSAGERPAVDLHAVAKRVGPNQRRK